MIDVHCHVLPGLDDGAPDEDVAVAMCRIAAEDGIRTLVATPHFGGPWGTLRTGAIEEATRCLRRRLALESIDLELRFAAEMPLTEESVASYESGAWPAYDEGRRYVLLEMPPIPNGVRLLGEAVFRLRLAGAVPVLAHSERLEMLDDVATVGRLVEQGALLQITAGCLGVAAGRGRRAQVWLRRGWVHAVASDAHDAVRRVPRLSAARRWLAECFGEDMAERLTRGNPEKMLAGIPI